MDATQVAMPATQTGKQPRGIRRFLESIGAKRRMRERIGGMGRRWWWISCSEPAHICMDNAWLRAEGYISFLPTPQTLIGNRRMP